MHIIPEQQTLTSGPSLRKIGIRIQPQDASAAQAGIDQQERLTLTGLNLLEFDQAYMVRPGVAKTPLPLEPGELNTARLFESLQRVGQHLDLETALDLHGAASSLIGGIRQQQSLDGPCLLVLTGAFGEIELDLSRLQPQALRAAFNSGLQEQPADELHQIHSRLADLSQLVRAGFEPSEPGQELDNWLAAVREPDFEPARFFQRALGYDPLSSDGCIRQLRQTMSTASAHPEMPDAEGLSLAEKTLELIKAANQLEASLDLAPAPDSPNILDLLRSFQLIVRQLEIDVARLLKSQDEKDHFASHLLTQFSERLQSNLRFHQQGMDALQDSGHQRIRLLVKHAVDQIQARIWLAEHGGANPQQASGLS